MPGGTPPPAMRPRAARGSCRPYFSANAAFHPGDGPGVVALHQPTGTRSATGTALRHPAAILRPDLADPAPRHAAGTTRKRPHPATAAGHHQLPPPVLIGKGLGLPPVAGDLRRRCSCRCARSRRPPGAPGKAPQVCRRKGSPWTWSACSGKNRRKVSFQAWVRSRSSNRHMAMPRPSRVPQRGINRCSWFHFHCGRSRCVRHGNPLRTRHYHVHPRGCLDIWTNLLARHTPWAALPAPFCRPVSPQHCHPTVEPPVPCLARPAG